MTEREMFLAQEPDLQTEKALKVWVWVLTGLVWVLVGLMRRPELKIPLPEDMSFGFLPMVNAGLNTLVSVSLVAALVAVKAGRMGWHRNFMTTAVLASIVFLLSYVTYHFTTPATLYGGEGAMRTVYFVILISHIALAALSFPFILLTLVFSMSRQYGKHKRLARWVFPVWLYVAVTGPVVYLMLRPYY